jgi:hypothetical protein
MLSGFETVVRFWASSFYTNSFPFFLQVSCTLYLFLFFLLAGGPGARFSSLCGTMRAYHFYNSRESDETGVPQPPDGSATAAWRPVVRCPLP